MNTIKLYEEDINRIVNYKSEKYYKNFIFNEFRLTLQREDGRTNYKIRINGDVMEVICRIISKGSYLECKYSIRENEEGWKFIENPNGELVEAYTGHMIDQFGASMTNKEISNKLMKYFCEEVSFILCTKQYIMNESYKRVVIRKESCKAAISKNRVSKRGCNSRKKVEQFLLGDIIEYTSIGICTHKITCECWSVRGHFRHYKDGKVVWISEYEKGVKRNSINMVSSGTYVV